MPRRKPVARSRQCALVLTEVPCRAPLKMSAKPPSSSSAASSSSSASSSSRASSLPSASSLSNAWSSSGASSASSASSLAKSSKRGGAETAKAQPPRVSFSAANSLEFLRGRPPTPTALFADMARARNARALYRALIRRRIAQQVRGIAVAQDTLEWYALRGMCSASKAAGRRGVGWRPGGGGDPGAEHVSPLRHVWNLAFPAESSVPSSASQAPQLRLGATPRSAAAVGKDREVDVCAVYCAIMQDIINEIAARRANYCRAADGTIGVFVRDAWCALKLFRTAPARGELRACSCVTPWIPRFRVLRCMYTGGDETAIVAAAPLCAACAARVFPRVAPEIGVVPTGVLADPDFEMETVSLDALVLIDGRIVWPAEFKWPRCFWPLIKFAYIEQQEMQTMNLRQWTRLPSYCSDFLACAADGTYVFETRWFDYARALLSSLPLDLRAFRFAFLARCRQEPVAPTERGKSQEMS